jgi:hypothetical protein
MTHLSARKYLRKLLQLYPGPRYDYHNGLASVSFEECLHYAAEGRVSLMGLVEHLECNGGRNYGGCQGQLLFDMIAMKVMNPRILFNITTI